MGQSTVLYQKNLRNTLVEIWTEELPNNWRWNPYCYVGGTPEFVVNTAECIKNDTFVYYDGEACEKDGVYYLPRSQYKGIDVVLACNSKPPSLGKHNIYWTNWFHQRQEDCLEFDERIVLSPYHQSIFGHNSRIVPHSCWPDKLQSTIKVRNQCLYTSSPDRGGEFLKEIWAEIELRTGAKLITTYRSDISESQMNELYKQSEFWLHPGQGVELFCISAVKAQVAKCIPVVVPNMALETTVKYGVKTTLGNYKEALVEAIENPPNIEEVNFGTWESVTRELFKNAEG